MLYLLFCALANVGILLCFRLFKSFKLNTFQAIVFNYITCVATGLLFLENYSVLRTINASTTWVWIAAVLGLIFIMTFYLMALTTQKFSMTVSSIAAKMSLIIPVMVSLLFLQVQSKEYTLLNYLGMLFAFPAILLSSIKKKVTTRSTFTPVILLLPIAVFLFGGIIDSTINYTNFHYLNQQTEAVFPIAIFTSASVIGLLSILIQRQKINLKNIAGGVVLGVINYFSIYFLLRALSAFKNDGAVLYPLLNVLIIVLSTPVSIILFKERLTRINLLGLLLAMVTLIFISYQELKILLNW